MEFDLLALHTFQLVHGYQSRHLAFGGALCWRTRLPFVALESADSSFGFELESATK